MGIVRQMKRSDLFLVRLRVMEAGEEKTEWQGHVQRATGGEIHQFHDLAELADLLRSMMPDGHVDREAQGPPPEVAQE